ncbi:hypothetical protein CSC76_16680 [Pseudoxanthomonas mexicana]|uniref:hypothetical protein n=1 Tax=Pseudoxanthomonas mexicana TaxID=128785 RepID=UPI00138A4B7C|nr:hypothetical protein [Pseudoxanthomonas mexicana]KAF1721003.1 hypothetical protein CSC76_16680 [Pseudoxanthomonas mexicana]
MTAGTKATQAKPITAHAVNAALPYQPRMLNRGERSRREVFVFFSPRNQRIVTIADTVNVAFAMQLEFDPTLSAYVERPRRLKLSDRQEVDISFWTRSKSGEERFHMLIPHSGNLGSTTGTLSVRDRGSLDVVAQRQGLVLHYVTEAELLASRAWLATAFELLPLVWEYGRLLNRALIRPHIEALVRNAERVSLARTIDALAYDPGQVQAVVAGMIHEGALRLVDYQPGARDAVLEVPHD